MCKQDIAEDDGVNAETSIVFEDMGPFEPVPMAKGDVLIYDNFMPHRSGTNATDSWRRALFGIYYGEASTPRDLRAEYYSKEAQGRRKAGSAATGGHANGFHTGRPVLKSEFDAELPRHWLATHGAEATVVSLSRSIRVPRAFGAAFCLSPHFAITSLVGTSTRALFCCTLPTVTHNAEAAHQAHPCRCE